MMSGGLTTAKPSLRAQKMFMMEQRIISTASALSCVKKAAGKHFYTNKQIVTASSSNAGIFSNFQDEFSLNQTVSGVTMDSSGF